MEGVYRKVTLTASGIATIAWNRYRDEFNWIDSILASSAHPDGDVRTKSDADDEEASKRFRLKHVQVLFCPGTSTPVDAVKALGKMSYTPILQRPHYQTNFPYDKQPFPNDPCTSSEWTVKEKELLDTDLHGGCCPGQLTNVGREKMVELGWKLKQAYLGRLKMEGYNNKKLLVSSYNTRRALDSTQSLLAGMYGDKYLQDIVSSGEARVPIYVECEHNQLLAPIYHNFPLLPHAHNLLTSSEVNVPRYRQEMTNIEALIDDNLTARLQDIIIAQNKLNRYLKAVEARTTAPGVKALAFNEERQPVTFDPKVDVIMKERNKAINKIVSFWPNVISNNPRLASVFAPNETKVMQYVTKFEVEEFQQRFQSGFRVKFHFSPNPYFHNTVLCKEIRQTTLDQSTKPISWSTPIQWKSGKAHTVKLTHGNNPNFFTWFLQPTEADNDVIGKTLKDEVWRNPLDYYKTGFYTREGNVKLKPIDFVALRNEIDGRKSLGLDCPECVQKLAGAVEENARIILKEASAVFSQSDMQAMTTLGVGRLLSQLMERTNPFWSNHIRLYLNCCSDLTMTGLLEALGLWDFNWPPQGSDLRLEIYEEVHKSNNKYIRVLYNGKAVTIRDNPNTTYVPWDSFAQALKMYARNPTVET